MTKVKTRIHVRPDGTLTALAVGLPVGQHEAEIVLLDDASIKRTRDADTLLARVRAIQERVAQLPVLDKRSPDEIIGYNENGYFD
jgi:hypothetical protein